MKNTITPSCASVQEKETSCILREASEEAAQENTTQHRYRVVLQVKEELFFFALYFPETAVSLKEEMKRIPGGVVSSAGGYHWLIPAMPYTVEALIVVLKENLNIFIPPYLPACLLALVQEPSVPEGEKQ